MIPQKIRQRMKTIQLYKRACFLQSEGCIRLCHIENKEYKYITIPFCDCKQLTAAAQLLKECGIVDSYKVIKINEQHFYIELQQFSGIRTHRDLEGNRFRYRVKKVVEWSELHLTQSDVKQFIARMELKATVTTPIIHLPPHYYKHSKQTA